MASVSAPPFPPPSDSTTRNFPFRNAKFISSSPSPSRLSSSLKKSSILSSSSSSRVSDSALCPCQNSSVPPSEDYGRWDSQFQEVVKGAMKKLEDYMNSVWNPVKSNAGMVDVVKLEKVEEEVVVENWDWDRWQKHFDEVVEQEKIVSVLKSQLGVAVRREVYKEAAKLKVAIAAAATNDIVGRVITCLNRAIEEEHYQDASFLRDYDGVGLVGWWAGISEDSDDPYGRIIRISAEHGRYVARSFSPRFKLLSKAGPIVGVCRLLGDPKIQAL